MPPKKKLSRCSLSNWSDPDADEDADQDAAADANVDISKTICGPPPYGGRHKYLQSVPERQLLFQVWL